MAFKGIDSNQYIKFLILTAVTLFILLSLIDVSAVSKCFDKDSKECNPLNKDIGQNTAYGIMGFLFVGFVMWIMWTFIIGTEGRWDKKKIVSFVLTGVGLYILYAYLLQPVLCATQTKCVLPPLQFAMYELHKSSPIIQSIIGMP